jgi:hypothetical protein
MSAAEELKPCGCCETLQEAHAHHNPPGQAQLTYRLGKHSSFKRRMITELPRRQIPDGEHAAARPLAALTTRADDDAAIALLDTWAAAAHVLTFYQERIANEGFLRTSAERLSVLELARAIGYELNPGVAASTHLAFTVDDSPGAPQQAVIPAGTQIQSLPSKKGELPQTFETTGGFTAQAQWNELLPLAARPQSSLASRKNLHLAGGRAPVMAGDLLLVVESGVHSLRRVSEVKVDREHDQTQVVFSDGSDPPEQAPVCAAEGAPDLAGLAFNAANIQAQVLDRSWSESSLQSFLKINGWDVAELLDYVNHRSLTGTGQVMAFRERAGLFGNTAPLHAGLPNELKSAFQDWDNGAGWEIWKDNVLNAYYTDADIYLDRVVSDLAEGSWVVLRTTTGSSLICRLGGAVESSIAGFAMSGKVTALDLQNSAGVALGNNSSAKPAGFVVRKTSVLLKSEALEIAPLPVSDDLPAGAVEMTLAGMVLGLQAGQPVALQGERADTPGVTHSEILTLLNVTHCGGHTTLKFTAGLSHSYRRSTLSINANVVPATHGETVADEILGSGDGAQAHQTFRLKKAPLTHIPASTPTGAQSTLSVQVNQVQWKQVSSLYGLGKNEHAYILRRDGQGSTRITFGDGKKGARLPTGQGNIMATYRTGIGAAGNLSPGSLTLMKTRPFGAKSVTNPVKASGADDPEALDDARASAPLTVLALERIVSLRDYEDFARAFAGVGKARAAALWNGEKQVVHVTIAGADGGSVPEASALFVNLLAAMKDSRNPLEEVSLGSFQLLTFDLVARLLIDPAYAWENVQGAIVALLLDAYAFHQRAFGQPVTAAGVVSTIHRAAGVKAVDLEALHLTVDGSSSPAPASVLPARLARPEGASGVIQPAELILINENGITLTEMETL